MPKPEVRFREVSAGRAYDFRAKGFLKRHFFPHRLHYLPRCGSDGLYLAQKIYSIDDPCRLRQVVLTACDDALDGIPTALFHDDDLIWHQQQLGMTGHVAAANLILDDRRLFTTARFSDIVQRISRNRQWATRVEKRFRGWDHMLLNGIFNYAVENGFREIHLPTGETARASTDPERHVEPALFERIYDDDVTQRFDAERRGDRWVVDVHANRHRLVEPEIRTEPLPGGRTISICHDTEAGLGHVGVDAKLSEMTAAHARNNLSKILEVEARRSIHGTYDVVGCLLRELREPIEAGGHEISFHSYDHTPNLNQLGQCRAVDNRIKGYRPPQSKITSELTDRHLARFNFEWLASSPRSIATEVPVVRAGIARMPIFFDDFPMYKSAVGYGEWETELLEIVRSRDFTAFGLHDCYAHLWLPQLDRLLERLADLGRIETVGEVAARTALGCAE